jgi:hypothetical protein
MFAADQVLLDMSFGATGEHATRLSLAGAYRPPPGTVGTGLDKAVFHKVAQATARSLLTRVADAVTSSPGPPGGVQETAMTHPAPRLAAPGLP